MPTSRTALFFCTQHWRSCFQVGTHHIARHFARSGWRVGFVGAPIGLPHLLGLGGDTTARVAAWRAGGSLDPDSDVWHCVPFAPLPWGASGLLGDESYVRTAWRLAAPGLTRVLRRAGLHRPDFACTDHLLHAGLLQAAAPRLSAFRRADAAAGFPGARPDFARREIELARSLDLAIVTNPSASQSFAAQGVRNTLLIENGLDLDRFRHDQPAPAAYATDPRPVVIYVGAADQRLDAALLLRAVRSRPQYRWTFVGPFGGDFARTLLREAGACIEGVLPHTALAAWLQHARVGIAPYSLHRHRELISQFSPLKVFEYAASGLPVVGTRGCLYPADLPVPLSVCDTAEDFIAAVDRHIAAGRPARPAAEAFARYDWAQRLQPLMAWLDERIPGSAAPQQTDAVSSTPLRPPTRP